MTLICVHLRFTILFLSTDQPDDDDTDFEEAGPGADDFEEFDREQGDEEPAETFRPKFDPEHLGSEEHPFGRKECK